MQYPQIYKRAETTSTGGTATILIEIPDGSVWEILQCHVKNRSDNWGLMEVAVYYGGQDFIVHQGIQCDTGAVIVPRTFIAVGGVKATFYQTDSGDKLVLKIIARVIK